jgi:hypothetical protein
MTPDLYGAWLEAGDRLQPVGDWLGRNGINLAVAVVLFAFAAWAIRRSLRDASRRVDDILADRPEPRQPGTDDGLLLDAYLAYYGPAGTQRLRDAIDQHRKEKS